MFHRARRAPRSAPGPRRSWHASLHPAFDAGRHGAGIQARAAADESLVYDASRELAAPQNELLRDAMYDDIARVHAEVQQRLAAVLIANENRGQVRIRREPESRVHSVVRGG